MRKLVSFLMVTLALSAGARRIAPEEAFSVASDFFNPPVASRAASSEKPVAVNRVMPESEVMSRARGEQAFCPYYVYNADNNRGFVIIAGDDRAPKVIGYSNTGSFSFTNIPPQLSAILQGYSERLENLSYTTTHPSWNAPARSDDDEAEGAGVLLTTANWGQGTPYNTLTPEIDGSHCPTGCVATAIAIVMKYHNWPDQGRSWDLIQDPYGEKSDACLVQHFSDYKFDYSDLPDSNLENLSPEQVNKLSTIMLAAGQAVRSIYGVEETSAYPQVLCHELHEKFAFSPECEFLLKSEYSDQEWMAIIKDQLDNNCPIIYSGYGATGGHTFVCDGYDDQNHIHINWGWDGYDNGYFTVDELLYGGDQNMTINISPDYDKTVHSKIYASHDNIYREFKCANNISVINVEKGVPFDIRTQSYRFQHGMNFDLSYALVDKDGNIKAVAGNSYQTVYPWPYFEPIPACTDFVFTDLTFDCEVLPTDRIQLCAKMIGNNDLPADSDWLLVLGSPKTPTSIPAKGNVPVYCNFYYDIDDLLDVTLINYGEETQLKGKGSMSMMQGKTALLNIENNLSNDKFATLTNVGQSFYESIEQMSITSNFFDFSFVFYEGDYHLTIATHDYEHDVVVTLDENTSLQSKIDPDRATCIGSLEINGSMDAFDFWYIHQNMLGLQRLDLSNVTIRETVCPEEVTFPTGGVAPVQQANHMPEWALRELKSLSEVKLPANLEGFTNMSLTGLAIETLTLPESVKNLGTNNFFNCQNLKTIISHNPEANYINDCNFTATKLLTEGTLYVPDESVELYKKASNWNLIPNILPLSEYTGISEIASEENSSLIEVYNLTGIHLMQAADKSALTGLQPGVYLLRQDGHTTKYIVR